MQSQLFIGGHMDVMNAPIPPDQESIQLPIGFGEKETYVRDTLTVGYSSVAIFRHESLISSPFIKAWHDITRQLVFDQVIHGKHRQ